MRGVVLAAGTGRRLRPYTDELPKALVPIGDGPRATTPLDVILGNFARVGVTEIAVVVGYAADEVRRRQSELEDRHGVVLELIDNDRATTWNNCYSLWCARELFASDVLLANGDTVHPLAVELALLGEAVDRDSGRRPASHDASLLLATDTVKTLGEEEMKVTWSPERGVEQITKAMDPAKAYGEYIGVATIRAAVADALADALEVTWRRDPGLYYEDGFQELIDRGEFAIAARPIGDQPWVEIDDHADLARADEILRRITTGSVADPGANHRLAPDPPADHSPTQARPEGSPR